MQKFKHFIEYISQQNIINDIKTQFILDKIIGNSEIYIKNKLLDGELTNKEFEKIMEKLNYYNINHNYCYYNNNDTFTYSLIKNSIFFKGMYFIYDGKATSYRYKNTKENHSARLIQRLYINLTKNKNKNKKLSFITRSLSSVKSKKIINEPFLFNNFHNSFGLNLDNSDNIDKQYICTHLQQGEIYGETSMILDCCTNYICVSDSFTIVFYIKEKFMNYIWENYPDTLLNKEYILKNVALHSIMLDIYKDMNYLQLKEKVFDSFNKIIYINNDIFSINRNCNIILIKGKLNKINHKKLNCNSFIAPVQIKIKQNTKYYFELSSILLLF